MKKIIESKLNESSGTSEFQAYITNLGKYNEGELRGQWVDFPIDSMDFQKVLQNIGINEEYEEWFVTDYDCEVDAYDVLGEYPSLEELNEFGKMIEDDAFKAILEDQGSFESAKSIYESGNYVFYPDIDDWTDYAYQYIDSIGGVEALQDDAENYFDYEALGRDLNLNYYPNEDMPETAGEYWCGDEDASDEDIGEAYVSDIGFDGVANSENYFDYEAFGRELSYDGSLTDYGIIFY